jgi:hypothetical protein
MQDFRNFDKTFLYIFHIHFYLVFIQYSPNEKHPLLHIFNLASYIYFKPIFHFLQNEVSFNETKDAQLKTNIMQNLSDTQI